MIDFALPLPYHVFATTLDPNNFGTSKILKNDEQ